MFSLLKKILKPLIPPILIPEKFREYFNKIFNRSKTKEVLKFEKNFYSRQAFINKAISKYLDCNYLEIGVGSNLVFNTIPLKMSNKFGVDPFKGGNFSMTSDDFFEENKNKKFDVVFIDGLHVYKQCQKDCINSMNSLNKNGIILFHDMIPRSYFEEQVPKKQ